MPLNTGVNGYFTSLVPRKPCHRVALGLLWGCSKDAPSWNGKICEICEICVRKKQIKIFRNSLAVTKIIPNFVADLCSATSVLMLERPERVLSLLA